MSQGDEKPAIEEGSSNVFADLGFPNPGEELLKAQLARQALTIIARRNLTQSEAANRLHVAQRDVAALVNGQLNALSVEQLIRILNALGSDVEIVVKAPTDAPGQLRVSVVA